MHHTGHNGNGKSQWLNLGFMYVIGSFNDLCGAVQGLLPLSVSSSDYIEFLKYGVLGNSTSELYRFPSSRGEMCFCSLSVYFWAI